jgi:serine phosphatase RsbU (regulator of sigma subunit)
MKRIYTLICFLILNYGYAQDQIRDSLNDKLSTEIDDTTICNIYIELGRSYLYSNLDTAYYFFRSAEKIASQLSFPLNDIYKANALVNVGVRFAILGNHKKALEMYDSVVVLINKQDFFSNPEYGGKSKKIYATVIGNIGIEYYSLSDFNKSLEYYLLATKLDRDIKNINGILRHYSNIGNVYLRMADYPRAMSYYYLAIKEAEKSGDVKTQTVNYSNLGVVFQDLDEYDNALYFYFKAFKLAEDQGNMVTQAIQLGNIGIIYHAMGDNQKALKYYFKALHIHQKVGNKDGIARHLTNIGVIYSELGDHSKAINYHMKSLKITKEIGDIRSEAINLGAMGIIYFKQKKYEKSETYLLTANNKLKEIGLIYERCEYSLCLSKLYEERGDYENSLMFFKKYNSLKDSLNNEENQKAVAKQQAKYEYEKQKALDDAEHEKQLAIEQEAKEKQKIITYSTAGGLALVALFLVFVFNRLQVTKKQKVVIQEAHYKLEEKNNEILDSIAYAKRIQTAILPPSKLVKEYLPNNFILYKPKDIVAGDFYWMEHKDGKVLFAAADCTGHGVPGAMVSVICNNGLNRSVREYNLTEPGKILDKTREIVIQEFEKSEDEVKDGMDIALCSLHNNTLQYAGANNPLWIIRNNTTEIEEIKATKQPIGKYRNPEPYITHTIELQKGDSIYIFSDGYADQFGGEKGKKFKGANFKKLLLSIQQETMERQKELINEAFENWRGKLEQIDDVCVIGVKV